MQNTNTFNYYLGPRVYDKKPGDSLYSLSCCGIGC